MWCAGISLLDQLSNGQVIVYAVAIISLAITPFFEPLTLFLVYLTIHSLFLLADILKFYAKRSSDKVARYGGDEFVVLLSKHRQRKRLKSC